MSDKILDIKNLSFYYSNSNTYSKQKWVKIFDNVNIDTNVGSVIGIAGKSGCGKTTLTKIINGDLDFEGNIKKGEKVIINYFAQNQNELLNPDDSQDLCLFS